MTAATIVYQAGSVEYLRVSVTADETLDEQTVQLSLDGGTTWLPAVWVGDAGLTRTARTATPVTWTDGAHRIRVKVTDSPEVPIIDAGTIFVA